ncbi:hypothetical protein [Brevibacillus centrosporus]|uniref:Uncharacterized protein n=1 Tax=Brevibacillus centrosporus TaxID=54910 RepID=A0A1I3TTY2_9BACL|nr:hypothetical protein [Brevibacillus centrosporus]MED4908553.1 hypothetical protein [Brevibacillus centrosporus]SFJ73051.1 hypothetical protein SAMN05518846_10555 [Brevibacillus centrosporus]
MWWIKWVTIHESYGLPRVAQECRRYLESQGIRVRINFKQTKRAGHVYMLQVPADQEELARICLQAFKDAIS